MTIPTGAQVHRKAEGRNVLNSPEESVNTNSKTHLTTESLGCTGRNDKIDI